MSKRLRPIVVSTLVGLLTMVWASCTSSDNMVITPNQVTPKNHPVIVVAPDAFTFTVDATDFSSTMTQAVVFSGDSLVATYVVTNYAGGSSTIDITGSDGNHVYALEPFSGNRTQVSVTAGFSSVTPKSISITLRSYTGTVSFVLARKK